LKRRSIAANGAESLQHNFENNNSDLILTIESSIVTCMRFLGFVLHAVTSESILSTAALLIGVIRQLSGYAARSLNDEWCNMPNQNSSASSTGSPSVLKGGSSLQSTNTIFLYYSSIWLAFILSKGSSANDALKYCLA